MKHNLKKTVQFYVFGPKNGKKNGASETKKTSKNNHINNKIVVLCSLKNVNLEIAYTNNVFAVSLHLSF